MTVKMSILAFVAILLTAPALVWATIGFADCPSCLPIAVHDAPGVGFDLTAGYGYLRPIIGILFCGEAHLYHRVSSVNFYDGPTKDVVKVEASQEYKDLIVRLSSSPKPSPYLINWPRRWLNKQLGWPSTRDVGILSSLIVDIKNATEAKLGIRLDKIVLAQPRFPALTAEDMGDAIEHAGLQSWLHLAAYGSTSEYHPPIQLSENRAALAAHGIRLCQEYGSYQVCIEGLSDEVHGSGSTYFASLSNSALYTSLDSYLQPSEYIGDYEPHFFDHTSGLDSIAQHPSNESYWASVRDKLVPQGVKRRISHVVIGGEAGAMPQFRKALHEALANVPLAKGALDSITGNTTIEYVDPVYAAARGAALLARWRQEAPSGCFETKECDERRKHEREGTPYVEKPKPPVTRTWRRLSSYELEDESEL